MMPRKLWYAIAAVIVGVMQLRSVEADVTKCKETGIIVNCTATMSPLPVPGMKNTYRDIIFQKNALKALTASSLRLYDEVQTLDLSHNKIMMMDERAFSHNAELVMLLLNDNLLTYLPEKIFRNNVKLTSVYLSNNTLHTITAQHFNDLTSLTHLRLDDNELSYIDADAFSTLTKLTDLYLEFNQLKTPSRQWVSHFNHTKANYELYMDNNPWSCDCNMRPFAHWAKKSGWFLTHPHGLTTAPKCHSPSNLDGMKIAKLNENEFICSSVVMAQLHDVNQVLHGDYFEIWCNATGVPVPYLQLRNTKGKLVEDSHKGQLFFSKNATSSDTGIYICSANGTDSHGRPLVKYTFYHILVHSDGRGKAFGITFGMIAIISICAFFIWFYKAKLSKTAKYSSIPDSSIRYEPSNKWGVRSQATPTMEPLSEDEELHYEKGDDKEVLV